MAENPKNTEAIETKLASLNQENKELKEENNKLLEENIKLQEQLKDAEKASGVYQCSKKAKVGDDTFRFRKGIKQFRLGGDLVVVEDLAKSKNRFQEIMNHLVKKESGIIEKV